jgi:hypothetical protein
MFGRLRQLRRRRRRLLLGIDNRRDAKRQRSNNKYLRLLISVLPLGYDVVFEVRPLLLHNNKCCIRLFPCGLPDALNPLCGKCRQTRLFKSDLVW